MYTSFPDPPGISGYEDKAGRSPLKPADTSPGPFVPDLWWVRPVAARTVESRQSEIHRSPKRCQPRFPTSLRHARSSISSLRSKVASNSDLRMATFHPTWRAYHPVAEGRESTVGRGCHGKQPAKAQKRYSDAFEQIIPEQERGHGLRHGAGKRQGCCAGYILVAERTSALCFAPVDKLDGLVDSAQGRLFPDQPQGHIDTGRGGTPHDSHA